MQKPQIDHSDSTKQGSVRKGRDRVTGSGIEALISEAAFFDSFPNFMDVSSKLSGQQVYFGVLPGGISNSLPLRMPTYDVGKVGRVIRVYTSTSHPGLARPFAGTVWPELVKMIQKMPEVDGIQMVNEADDWIILPKAVLVNEPDKAQRSAPRE